MIELTKVSASYGKNVIYNDFSFEFPRGVNVVLGASGSGKTTLLRAICGLIDFDGSIKCDPVAAVFQNPCLAPVSALSNVAAVLKGKDAETLAMRALALCRIDHKARVRATKLSGGEQQRVALARAVAADRPVLLLDEPFRSLDYAVKLGLYATFNELIDGDKTVLFVTHDVDEALLTADRIYFLYERPAQLAQVITLDVPRTQRDVNAPSFAAHRARLQQILADGTLSEAQKA